MKNGFELLDLQCISVCVRNTCVCVCVFFMHVEDSDAIRYELVIQELSTTSRVYLSI